MEQSPATTGSVSQPDTRCGISAATAQSAKSNSEERVQPWKGHWAPKTTTQVGFAYGVKRGDTVKISGN